MSKNEKSTAIVPLGRVSRETKGNGGVQADTGGLKQPIGILDKN